MKDDIVKKKNNSCCTKSTTATFGQPTTLPQTATYHPTYKLSSFI